jgi:outer membrane protein assembly factor BamB
MSSALPSVPAIIGLVLLAGCGEEGTGETAMFRGDPQHRGVYETAGIAQSPAVLWRFPTGDRVLSTPALSHGVVYFGSDDGFFYAVDTTNGEQIWSYRTGDKVRSSPAVADGVVFFGSYDGNFYAVHRSTGREKWRFRTTGERHWRAKNLDGMTPAEEVHPDPWDFFLSSPVLAEGVVYFGTGEGMLYALDTGTGQPVWTFETGDTIHSSPAIADGTLYVGNMESRLYAVDTATGQERWHFQAGTETRYYNQHGLQSSPTVAGGMVYIGGRDGGLHAVSAADGREVWKFDTENSWVLGSPSYRNGTVYFGTSDTFKLMAVDGATGQARFEVPTGTYTYSSPAIAGDMVYVGTCGGVLFAVDATTGAVKWTFQTEASERDEHDVLNPDGTWNYGNLFAGEYSYENAIAAVDRFLDLGAFLSSPVVADAVLYIGSADGHLYALGSR